MQYWHTTTCQKPKNPFSILRLTFALDCPYALCRLMFEIEKLYKRAHNIEICTCTGVQGQRVLSINNRRMLTFHQQMLSFCDTEVYSVDSTRNISVSDIGLYCRQGFSFLKPHIEVSFLVSFTFVICISWIIIKQCPLHGFQMLCPFLGQVQHPEVTLQIGNPLNGTTQSLLTPVHIPFPQFPLFHSLSHIHFVPLPYTNHWFFRGSIKYLRCVGRPLSLGIWREKIILKAKL